MELSLVRSVRLWGVLGIVLALAVAGYSQTVFVEGFICRIEIALTPPYLRCVTQPGISITLKNAANGREVGSSISDGLGRFRITFALPPGGIHVYAVLTGTGFKRTATFIVHVTGNISGIRLPVIREDTYTALKGIATDLGYHHDDRKNIIFALFHPTGKLPDGTPESIHRGVAIDARDMFLPWPNVVSVVPPGRRVWFGLQGGWPRCVEDYKQTNFFPVACIIYNAERFTHQLGSAVIAYRFGFAEVWPRPTSVWASPCPFGRLVGAAPTDADITVGVVRCELMPFEIPRVFD